MEKRNRFALILSTILVATLTLSSCNLPATTEAPVSLATPTEQPVENVTSTDQPVENTTPMTATATPTDETPAETPSAACDHAEFVADVTYPDNTSVDAAEKITKTWRVKNIGDCPWDSAYRLVFVRGEQMDGVSPAEIITDPVAPGKSVELSIDLTAPTINGTHWGVWRILNADGKPLLQADGTPQELTILIKIENGEGGKVTSVHNWSYTYNGTKCGSVVQYDVTTSIYASGPVNVNYTWYTTSGNLTVVTQNYVFEGPGSVEVTTSVVPPFADPNNVTVTLSANGISNSFTICP
ncbi:hypothetical protein EG834_07065 [bacterium]|nr:hypothetical protein [bacterium]